MLPLYSIYSMHSHSQYISYPCMPCPILSSPVHGLQLFYLTPYMACSILSYSMLALLLFYLTPCLASHCSVLPSACLPLSTLHYLYPSPYFPPPSKASSSLSYPMHTHSLFYTCLAPCMPSPYFYLTLAQPPSILTLSTICLFLPQVIH